MLQKSVIKKQQNWCTMCLKILVLARIPWLHEQNAVGQVHEVQSRRLSTTFSSWYLFVRHFDGTEWRNIKFYHLTVSFGAVDLAAMRLQYRSYFSSTTCNDDEGLNFCCYDNTTMAWCWVGGVCIECPVVRWATVHGCLSLSSCLSLYSHVCLLKSPNCPLGTIKIGWGELCFLWMAGLPG